MKRLTGSKAVANQSTGLSTRQALDQALDQALADSLCAVLADVFKQWLRFCADRFSHRGCTPDVGNSSNSVRTSLLPSLQRVLRLLHAPDHAALKNSGPARLGARLFPLSPS